jgi:predicted DsbA family dithiol-disulfide isomerase
VSATRVAAVLLEPIEFDLFYDYTCPFVYRAAEMLDTVQKSGERELSVRWRYFSLAQVNSRDGGWTAWGAPETEAVRGRPAFRAAEAARKQGEFAGLHMALLRARHVDRQDIDDPKLLTQIAEAAGLEVDEFRRDLANPATLEALERDHTEARSKYGVFGTPTFVFAGGAAAYVRLAEVPPAGDAVRVFDHIVAVARGEQSILEIKRPVAPV